MPGGQQTNGWGPGNQWLGTEHKWLGARRSMSEVGEINGCGPGKKWLGPRKAMGGVQESNGEDPGNKGVGPSCSAVGIGRQGTVRDQCGELWGEGEDKA